jgi:hypothetical protein
MLQRLASRMCLLSRLVPPLCGQEPQHWTERRNLGFEGAVRSVRTTVERPNPDSRPQAQRKLMAQANPDWAVFDLQGRRIEFASASNRDGFEAISKCTFRADGTRVCTDRTGRTQETQREETTLPDGSREVTYRTGSKMDNREVTHFDEKGNAVSSRNYDNSGRLTSEDSTLPNGDDEWKIYDEKGKIVQNCQTRESNDKTRFDRWSYDSEGQLVWHLALNGDGELLTYWYKIGHKPILSSSGSLGTCRRGLCVDYKFDEQGSGRMEKTVQHTSGEGNLEPDSEEHYNLEGVMDEKTEIKYARDSHGNWNSRTVFFWDATSNRMIEVERDTRAIDYY